MNRNQISKLSIFILLTLVATPNTFGMNEGAGSSAAHAVGVVRRNPDYILNERSFILVSNDGQEIGVPEKVITDTFKGKPLSLVLNKLFSSGMSETGEGKANADFPADTLRTFIDVLIAMHILAGTEVDLDNQEIIEAFSKQLPMLTNYDTTHYIELIQIADYYDVAFLKQVIGNYLLNSDRFLKKFIKDPGRYKDLFAAITSIRVSIEDWVPQIPKPHGHIRVPSEAVSPDHQQVASWSGNFIDIKHKNPDGTLDYVSHTTDLESPTGYVYSVAFSHDGKQIVGGGDGAINIWHKNPDDDTFNSQPQTLRKFGRFTAVAFSADGQQIVSGSWDGTMNIWHKNPGGYFSSNPQTLREHHTVLSPDGQQGSRSGDESTSYFNRPSFPDRDYERIESWDPAAITFVEFFPDDRCILSQSRDHTMKGWDKDLIPFDCSLLQALFIEYIKHMFVDLSKETEVNLVWREIARSFIGTPAEQFVRSHVRMDWASHAGAGSSSSSATVTDQGESAGAQQ